MLHFVTDVLSLKETCMSVIMSNLLQQLNLNADQLQDRLPDYVPTTLRKAIICNYGARAFPLHLFPAATQSTSGAIGETGGVDCDSVRVTKKIRLDIE